LGDFFWACEPAMSAEDAAGSRLGRLREASRRETSGNVEVRRGLRAKIRDPMGSIPAGHQSPREAPSRQGSGVQIPSPPLSRSYSNSGERREARRPRRTRPADLAILDVDGLEHGVVEAASDGGSRLGSILRGGSSRSVPVRSPSGSRPCLADGQPGKKDGIRGGGNVEPLGTQWEPIEDSCGSSGGVGTQKR
jgi:hypothetical protein